MKVIPLRDMLILFLLLPVLSVLVSKMRFIPPYDALPFYGIIVSGLLMLIVGFMILAKIELYANRRFVTNRFKRSTLKYFSIGVLVAMLLVFLILPMMLSPFIDEKLFQATNIGDRRFFIYAFGHKASKSIIYEQNSGWTMDKIGEINCPPSIIEIRPISEKMIQIKGCNKTLMSDTD
jgi:hypothetical protein